MIGVDGGGTKTAIAVAACGSAPAVTSSYSGCSYQTLGVYAAVEVVCKGISECLAASGIGMEACAACCIGMPCYGENAQKDEEILALFESKLSPIPVYLTNDVEIGWAGAADCAAGVHIVSGTGAIAFGCDSSQKTARSGGWHEFFGDEGSCYWIGRETMSLFTKEADGRIPKGPLYHIIRRELGIVDDFQFIDWILREITPFRDQVAGFQRYTLQAAQEGDAAAIALYCSAAKELALLVKAIKTQLPLSETGKTTVTYSGGLFHAGEFILTPLAQELQQLQCQLSAPRHTAVEGALMLANRYLNNKKEYQKCT